LSAFYGTRVARKHEAARTRRCRVALVLLPALSAAACGGILTKVEVRAACRCHDGCTMRLCPRAPPVETETRYRDRS